MLDLELLRRFWKAPSLARKPGLKAVDMFDAVATGKIKAIWIMATNPADSMPDAAAVAFMADVVFEMIRVRRFSRRKTARAIGSRLSKSTAEVSGNQPAVPAIGRSPNA